MKMKKIGFLLAGVLFVTSVFAQTTKQPEIESKEELKFPISKEMASIQTAYQLAEYARDIYIVDNASAASSYLRAAGILAEVPKLDIYERQPVENESIAEEFLRRGKIEAKQAKDKSLLAYAKTVEKKIKSQRKYGNPVLYSPGFLKEFGDIDYYRIKFDELLKYAEIFVHDYREKGTSIGLYVYDESWNLIAKDTSGAGVVFKPSVLIDYRIVVVNNSKHTGIIYGIYIKQTIP